MSKHRQDEPDEPDGPDQGLPEPPDPEPPEPEPEPTEACKCVLWPPCSGLAVGAYDLCADCANDDEHEVRPVTHAAPSITEMWLIH